jgi:hypothetical protein
VAGIKSDYKRQKELERSTLKQIPCRSPLYKKHKLNTRTGENSYVTSRVATATFKPQPSISERSDSQDNFLLTPSQVSNGPECRAEDIERLKYEIPSFRGRLSLDNSDAVDEAEASVFPPPNPAKKIFRKKSLGDSIHWHGPGDGKAYRYVGQLMDMTRSLEKSLLEDYRGKSLETNFQRDRPMYDTKNYFIYKKLELEILAKLQKKAKA